MEKYVEVKAECTSCGGTGLYVGMCERDGAAVVCHACKGKGFVEQKIKVFSGRKEHKFATRVFQTACGIEIGMGKNKNGTILRLEDFGGMPVKDWLEGKPFPEGSEMRKFTCPAWWYQSADYKKKPEWEQCVGIGSFSDCKCFGNKWNCWERWDKEFGGRK